MLVFETLMIMMHSGPGLWVLSQALLLLYFKMDNGSNVCGVEFNYNNKEGGKKKKEEKDVQLDMAEEYFDGLLLRKLIPNKFDVRSEEGRSVYWSQHLQFL